MLYAELNVNMAYAVNLICLSRNVQLIGFFVTHFPDSRGPSRRAKKKTKGERPLSASLTTSDVFFSCVTQPENRFEFERECKWLLNLSTRSNFKWTNQSSFYFLFILLFFLFLVHFVHFILLQGERPLLAGKSHAGKSG